MHLVVSPTARIVIATSAGMHKATLHMGSRLSAALRPRISGFSTPVSRPGYAGGLAPAPGAA